MTECNSHSKQDKKYNEENQIAPAEPASASHECPIDSSEIFNGFSQFETSGAPKASKEPIVPKDVTTGTLESTVVAEYYTTLEHQVPHRCQCIICFPREFTHGVSFPLIHCCRLVSPLS